MPQVRGRLVDSPLRSPARVVAPGSTSRDRFSARFSSLCRIGVARKPFRHCGQCSVVEAADRTVARPVRATSNVGSKARARSRPRMVASVSPK